MRYLWMILMMCLFTSTYATDAQSTSSLPINMDHVQYWIKILDTHPMAIYRKQAARHLGAMQNDIANPSLIKCLSDSNEDVRIQCTYSLGRLGDQTSLRPLYELIQNSSSPQVKSAAKSSIDKINAHEEFERQRKQKLREFQLEKTSSAN